MRIGCPFWHFEQLLFVLKKGYLIFAINLQTYASNDVFSQHSMSSRCHSSSHKVCAFTIWIESRNGLYSIICMTVDQCKNRAVLLLWVLRSNMRVQYECIMNFQKSINIYSIEGWNHFGKIIIIIVLSYLFFYFGVLKRRCYTNANSQLFMHSTS